MSGRPPAVDPVAAALAFAIRRAVERKAAEEAARRRTLSVVGAKTRGGKAA